MTAPIRLLLASDQKLFCQGLRSLLQGEPDIEVVGEIADGSQISALLARQSADQLLLDLPIEHGLATEIESYARSVSVLVLTVDTAIGDALTAVRLGARAVVFKRSTVEVLLEAIRTVARGHVWLPAVLQTHMAAQLRHPSSATLLSPREAEVFRYVALGCRNAEVASKLSISEPTVKTHLNSIFRKLGLRDRVELVLYANSGKSGEPPR